MVGIGRPVVVGLVARITVGGNGRVIAIDMAGGTSDGRVCAGQREHRVMVKRRGRPGHRGVAESAVGGEACRDVIGIGGAGEILGVAGIAVERNRGVVVIDVALRARHGNVRPGQGELGGIVIETRSGPVGGAMAGFAGCRETTGRVRRGVGVVVIDLVAPNAIGGQRCVVVVDVARGASDSNVRPGERKLGRVVVKGRAGPVRCTVASLTRCREANAGMRRSVGVVEIGLMAADAGCGERPVVGAGAGVALRALHGGVEACQWE